MQIPEIKTQKPFETLLPLINVVFLLLIFFMLAGSFSAPELFKIQSPSADNDDKADRKEITLLINAEGKMALNKVEVDFEKLKSFLAQQENQTASLQIKADKHLKAGELLNVLDIIEASKIETVRLLTVSE